LVFERAFFIPALRARFGDNLLFAGDEQKTFRKDFLSATPDGLLVHLPHNVLTPLGIEDIGGDGSLITECKTRDPRARMDRPQPAHVYQVNVQLGLVRDLTPFWPANGLLFYADASFWDEMREFVIPFDFEIYKTAKQRAARIMLAKSAAELRPEGYIAGGHECEYCAFQKACAHLRADVPAVESTAKVDPQFSAEIVDRARAAKEQQAVVEDATTKLRTLQYEIKERLREKNLRRVQAAGVTVTWSFVKGRTSYDMPALKAACEAAGIDTTQFETTGDPSDRLTVAESR
jgi:hypothetical protein